MAKKRLLILGGYGNTGRHICRLLLQETDVELMLGGRSPDKAHQAADELNREIDGKRAAGMCVDASLQKSLQAAFQDVDMIIAASSTAEYARLTAEAALSCDIDYLDIHFSPDKVRELQSLKHNIQKAGRCFITEAGFHPGLPAALIRHAAKLFTEIDSACVGSLILQKIPTWDSVTEIVNAYKNYNGQFYENGRWRKFESRKFDFGNEFGKRTCYSLFLEELRQIPQVLPALTKAGFYMAGFNWFVDWFFTPAAMLSLKIWPRIAINPLAACLRWGINTFSSPPFGTLLKVEAHGVKNGQKASFEMRLFNEDAYLFTAIAVVACLLQYLDGRILKPGLWMMGQVVEPRRLLKDMKRMGIEITEKMEGADAVNAKR
ncbi:MAG: saccharopine dehydrogenase family protein [bacterium]